MNWPFPEISVKEIGQNGIEYAHCVSPPKTGTTHLVGALASSQATSLTKLPELVARTRGGRTSVFESHDGRYAPEGIENEVSIVPSEYLA